MVKKPSSLKSHNLSFTNKLTDSNTKLIQIEFELIQSQLNKKYRELGEYVFNSLQRKKQFDLKATKWIKINNEIKELLNKINKYKKVGN